MDPSAISKTIAPTNMKFYRVLETFVKVLKMLKFLHNDYLVTMVTPQKRCVLSGKSLDFSQITNIKVASKFTILEITL